MSHANRNPCDSGTRLLIPTADVDAVAKIKANATQRALDLAGIVAVMRASGLTSVRSIAEALNEQGIRAPRGDKWHPTAVSRLLTRLAAQGLPPHGTRSRSSTLMITLAVRLKREMGPLRALKIPGFLQNGL
jgi:Recombinase